MPATSRPPDDPQSISFFCGCGEKFVADAAHSGKRLKCPSCGQIVVIPSEPADIDPTTTEVAPESLTQRGKRWLKAVLSFIALWSVPVAVSIGGVALVRSDLKRKQQERIDVANTEVREAVKGADDWIKHGRERDGEDVEHRLLKAIAASDVSEKGNAHPVLQRVRTRRAEWVADSILESAKKKLDAKAIVEAVALLRPYVTDPHATKKPEAEQLLADCDVATSDSAAVNALVTMSDEQFARFKNTGKLDDRDLTYPFLMEMRAAALRRSLEKAGPRREEYKIAEAKRQKVAEAAAKKAAYDLAISTGKLDSLPIRERIVGIWDWGSGGEEMRFAADGTFLERCSSRVVSKGRWSLGEDGHDWVHGNIQMSYDNGREGRVALSRKEDLIGVDLHMPNSPWTHFWARKIEGNPSFWNPVPADILMAKMREKVVGIWGGPTESEVKFAEDGTFVERNWWGIVSRGQWTIEKGRYGLLLMKGHLWGEFRNAIVVNDMGSTLEFNVFDDFGNWKVHADEKELAEHAGPIENLKKEIVPLWLPHVVTEGEKGRVINTVSSILGLTPKDPVLRLTYDDHRYPRVFLVNPNVDRIPVDDRLERSKVPGNPSWWDDQSELIRAKLVGEWRWGQDLWASITFDADETFVQHGGDGLYAIDGRGRWSVDKDNTIRLSAVEVIVHYPESISPVARMTHQKQLAGSANVPGASVLRMNLKEDRVAFGQGGDGRGPGRYPHEGAIRYREKPLTEADIPGVWVYSPGALGETSLLSREMTLLPNGKIDDPAGQSTWALTGKTLVLRWADHRAPGGFWIDTGTVSWGPKQQRLHYSGANQQNMKIAGRSGKLPPWFEKARQEAPAVAWGPCLAVPDVFWSEKARQQAHTAIANRNAINAEARAREDEYWRKRIEAAGREASAIFNAPGPPGPTANELTRKEQEELYRRTGGRMGTSPGFK